jgi:hypothetical protein
MIDSLTTYYEDDPPEGYAPFTYAYDLLTDDRDIMFKEVDRLKDKGVDVLVKVWDTRESGEGAMVGPDNMQIAASVFGELWVRE